MEEETKTLSIIDEVKTNTNNLYTSLEPNSMQARKQMYNAMGQCDFRVADKLNTPIALTDVILQKYDRVKEETGEVETKYRIILIDSELKTYASASRGLFNSLMRLFAIVGEPTTWSEPLNIEVVETSMKNGGKTYTIKTL